MSTIMTLPFPFKFDDECHTNITAFMCVIWMRAQTIKCKFVYLNTPPPDKKCMTSA
jgi:hypothetical protein